MKYRNFGLFFLFSAMMIGQSIDASKVATVHVYRQGRLLISVSVFADGNRVVGLTPHESATFYLVPGFHELTMQAGEISPTASFKAVAGDELFFEMSYEHVVSATSLRELSVSLSLQPKMVGPEEVREVKIDQGALLQVLAQSNPDGLEPKDPILTDANANSPETAAYLASNQENRR
jgi:hypothetical protein